MVKSWQKFLLKLEPKLRFKMKVTLKKIIDNNHDGLDIKPINGKNGYFRCRIGGIRIIFIESGKDIIVHDIGYRGDVYKGL